MTSWLRGTSWFQRFALLAAGWSILQVAHNWATGESGGIAYPAVAALLCYFAFRQQILWRVRNRLLVTFVLLGVVPIFLIALMLSVAGQLAVGQFASVLAGQELEQRTQPPTAGDTFAHGAIILAGVFGPDPDIDIHLDPSGMKVYDASRKPRQELRSSQLPPAQGWWDGPVVSVLVRRDQSLALLSRPSALLAGSWSGPVTFYGLWMLSIAGGFLFAVWLWSIFASARLTRTVTGAMHELYTGTQHVAEGDFTHQIPVYGTDQLSELAASFNGMTTRMQHLIGEEKKKEKLEAELEIARQVQVRLFPETVPTMAKLEMTGVCIPGRVVSGDYYDFIKLDEHKIAIALGDVSGKGVSAALLMAGIQSALHSQLKYRNGDAATLSTATLMEQMSQQLYDNTPPEKYATFFCALYDDQTGLLSYTNAGHLKPILVRDGETSVLEGDGLVAGLLPNVTYDQQRIQLRHGDLIAIFSDGVSEAEDAQQREFGEASLAEVLRKHAEDPLPKLLTMITGAVNEWIHDPDGRDDTTVVLLRKR